METIEQARARALSAAAQAEVLVSELDTHGKSDQDDDADARARGMEAIWAAREAQEAHEAANKFGFPDIVRAQADRAERALARVRERLGADPDPGEQINMRTMRIELGVTVINTDVAFNDPTRASIELMQRVVEAILPHPDDAIHTGHGNERVAVIMRDWEVTS